MQKGIIRCGINLIALAFPHNSVVEGIGTSKVSFAEATPDGPSQRRRLTLASATSDRGRSKAPFRGSTQSRHLALFETAATSAVTVGSIEFSVNGRPSEAVEGGVTSVRVISSDDGSVRADQHFFQKRS